MLLLEEIRGQNPAVATLRNALAGGRVASAYLFDGPCGVGKRSTALGLAKARLCRARPGRGCHSCGTCQRIDAGHHPDVRLFTPRDEGHRNLPVKTLREEILPIAQYAPFEAEAAFLIFREADVAFPAHHPESANALLKTLEEPRPGVHFLLLAARPDRLLDTIRSRCQRVRFGALPAATLEHILEQQGVPPAQASAAIALADGRADRALALAEDGAAERLLERAMRVDDHLAAAREGALLQLSEELARGDDLRGALDTLVTFYRDVAVCALGLGPERLRFRHAAAEIQARARRTSAARAAERVRRLVELGESLDRNANPQIALDALLLELSAG